MNNSTLDLWRRLLKEDKTATFFQTPEWHGLASQFFGTETTVKIFTFGNKTALLPLQKKNGFFGSFYSSPFGTYNSLLVDHHLEVDEINHIKKQLVNTNLVLTSSPFTQNPIQIGNAKALSTKVIELDQINSENPSLSWNRNHRRKLNEGLQNNIKIRLAESENDIHYYYLLYQKLSAEWGSAARVLYPEKLFTLLWSSLKKSNKMKIWIAEKEGKIVAGRICFYHGFHAVEWHAASTGEFQKKGVNHLLINTILGDAKKNGFQIYDFNPNPGLSQVDHFKMGFHPKILTFSTSMNFQKLYAWIHRLRNTIGN